MGAARIDRVGREARRRSSRRRRSPTSTATAPARAGSAMAGSHSLQAFVNEVAARRPGPARRPARASSKPSARRALEQARSDRRTGKAAAAATCADRRARIRIRLHRVPRSPADRVAEPGLRRRRTAAASITRSTTRSTGTRTSPTATSLIPRRCRARSARRCCGSPTPTSCRSSSASTANTLRCYVDELEKLSDDAKAGVDLKPLRKSIDGLADRRREVRVSPGPREAGRGPEASRN